MKSTTQLRKLLKEPGMLVAPGCVDPISARVVEHLGFKAVYMTGSGAEAASLGHPDLGLKTLTETTELARRITDAVGIPLICDAEAGFGDVINVVRTVRAFEKAGVAAIHIEDQETPPNSPGLLPRRILPREVAVAKIKAAVDVRTDADFVIVARSDADEISVDELIERCNLYLEAGADLAMAIVSKIDGQPRAQVTEAVALETHRRIRREVKGTLLGLGLPASLTTKEIESFGYKVYIYPTDAFQASVAATYEVNKALKEAGTVEGYFKRHPRLDAKEYARLIRTQEWLAWEERGKKAQSG